MISRLSGCSASLRCSQWFFVSRTSYWDIPSPRHCSLRWILWFFVPLALEDPSLDLVCSFWIPSVDESGLGEGGGGVASILVLFGIFCLGRSAGPSVALLGPIEIVPMMDQISSISFLSWISFQICPFILLFFFLCLRSSSADSSLSGLSFLGLSFKAR